MIYIILTILISVSLLLFFKLFGKFNVNSFHAIFINYLIAGITGLLFSSNSIQLSSFTSQQWIWVCLPLGILFIGVFYLISLTTQKINIATASVANKMSVVLPVLSSIFILNQSLSYLKSIGILLALVSIYLSTYSKSQTFNLKLFLLPFSVFIGSGLIDVSINLATAYLFKEPMHGELFSIGIFFSAFFIGLLVILVQISWLKEKVEFKAKSILWGVALGVPNYFSIYFIIKAIESNIFSTAELFPILNISNVLLATLSGLVFFKERLSNQNKIGVLLAIVAILLIAY